MTQQIDPAKLHGGRPLPGRLAYEGVSRDNSRSIDLRRRRPARGERAVRQPGCRGGVAVLVRREGVVTAAGIGRALGSRYTLIERIGQGASGEVWRAEDRQTGESVAAKLLWPQHSSKSWICIFRNRSINNCLNVAF